MKMPNKQTSVNQATINTTLATALFVVIKIFVLQEYVPLSQIEELEVVLIPVFAWGIMTLRKG